MISRNLYVGMALAAYSASALAATLDDVEQLVEEKWNGITSFRADISVDVKVPLGPLEVPSNAEGTIELMMVESGRKYRVKVKNHLAKSFLMRDGLTQDVLTIFDGEHEYTELTIFGRKQVNKRVPDTPGANQPMGGSAVFERLRSQGDVTLAGETEIDGAPVWIIDVKSNGKPIEVQGPIEPSRIRVFLSQESGLQVRLLMFDEKNEELLRMRYSNLQLNPELEPARFTYTPPPGVEVKEGKPLT